MRATTRASTLLVEAADEQTARAIREGRYQHWDCLRQRYDQVGADPMFDGHFVVDFDGNYNMRRMAALYAQLPGIASASPNATAGGGSSIEVDRHDEE